MKGADMDDTRFSPGRENEGGNFPAPPAPREDEGEFTQVEVERMEAETGGMRGGVFIHQSGGPFPKPPVIGAWACLFLSWLFLGSKIPFTVFIGIPFNIVALFLGLLCAGRGASISGGMILLLGTVGSCVVYLFGLIKFLGGLTGGLGLV